MKNKISSALFMLLLSGLMSLSGCNPAGQTQIAESFMPGVNSSRIISISSGNNQSALHSQLLPLPLVVFVKDDQNKPVENVKILWSASAGTLSQSISYTNERGQASNTLTLAGPGVHTITAVVEESLSAATFNASATTTSFTASWPFTSSLDYEFDSTLITFNSGIVGISAFDQTDDDFSLNGFGAITQNGIVWDATNNFIRLSQAGSPNNILGELDASWAPHWGSIYQYLRMNGSTGSITAGTTLSATIGSNGVASGSTLQYVAARMNEGVKFNGGTDQVNFPCNTTVTNSFTLSAWVKATATHEIDGESNSGTSGTTGQKYLFDAPNPGLSTEAGAGVSVGTNGISVYEHAPGYMPALAVYNGTVGTDWAHIVVVYNNRRPSIYLNGALVKTGLLSPRATIRPTCSIGKGYYGNFISTVDEVVMWNTALSAADISAIYQKQLIRYSGSFNSRVFDAFSPDLIWNSTSWLTSLPFFKELPDFTTEIQNESASDYSSLVGSTGTVGDNNLMNGLIGLWHFNEAAANSAPNGADFKDDSGQDAHAVIMNEVADNFNGPGRFSASFAANGSAQPKVTHPNANVFSSGVATVSFWMRWNGSNNVMPFGFLNYDLDLAGGHFGFNTGNGDIYGINWSGLQGQWVHVAAEFRHGDYSSNKLYINGQLQTLTQRLGSQNPARALLSSTFYFTGWGGDAGYRMTTGSYLDEVAVWNRSLHAKEVFQLYRRGANRIRFQVRTCSANDCSDDGAGSNWHGPDGSRGTFFSELTNQTVNSASAAFTLPASRYFQYRALLESDDTSTSCNYGSGVTWCSPELKSVTVGPDHYTKSAPTVISKNPLAFHGLTSLTERLGAACAEGVTYKFSLDKTSWYWWNGSEWTIADGSVSQSNEVSAVNSSLSNFSTQIGRGNVYVKAFLKSNGSSKCELDSLELEGEI